MTEQNFIFLIIALFSAIVSGSTGLGGGVIQLVLLANLFPLHHVIALHAVIQVISNFTRVITFFQHINWHIFWKFNLLSIPFAYLGAMCIEWFNEHYLQILVAFMILYTVVGKQQFRHMISSCQHDTGLFIVVGTVASFISMIIGVVGPLITPFFLASHMQQIVFVASKSACQFALQMIKFVIFLKVLFFPYSTYKYDIFYSTLGIIIGTWGAKKILQHIDVDLIQKVTQFILVVLALKIFYQGIYGILV